MSAYIYTTKGTCSQTITVELDGKIIKKVVFEGGCDGNLKGIAKLVVGMDMDSVVQRFSGILCGSKSTSCPDQLATALQEAYIAQQENTVEKRTLNDF
ncbi:MAG: TIGR03905 family TSCPD domain-containing protein [Selenomonadaceae bacterium]